MRHDPIILGGGCIATPAHIRQAAEKSAPRKPRALPKRPVALKPCESAS